MINIHESKRCNLVTRHVLKIWKWTWNMKFALILKLMQQHLTFCYIRDFWVLSLYNRNAERPIMSEIIIIIIFFNENVNVLVAILKIYIKKLLISHILQVSYCEERLMICCMCFPRSDCLSVTGDIMDLWNVNNTIWDQHTVLASRASPAGGTDALYFSIHSNTLTPFQQPPSQTTGKQNNTSTWS